MISVFISYANKTTEEWESVCIIELKPGSEVYPNDIVSKDYWGINDFSFSLQSGESLKISVAFTKDNLGLSFGVNQDGKSLFSAYLFKRNLDEHDPSIVFRTLGGIDVSIMFGPVSI